MSTELVIRMWFDERASPGSRLLSLIPFFEQQGIHDGTWKGLVIRDAASYKELFRLQEKLTSAHIAEVLAGYDGDHVHLSARTALPCWRFNGTVAEDGYIPCWIETWGTGFVSSTGRRREIEGDAAFIVSNSGPFIALLEPEADPHVQQVNQYVGENLERITTLILTIANDLQPWAIKGFTEQGLDQPLNAHLVFFRDPQVLINDVAFLKELWDHGLPGYSTPPLRDSVKTLDRYALHYWRGVEASQALCAQLADVIGTSDHLTVQQLAQIAWWKYDNYEVQQGRAVLEYPYWLNSFLDRFYLDLLKSPDQAESQS